MTVASTTNRKSFSGDAVTTSFGTSPVVFYESTDLVVQVYSSAGVATTLTEGTHYSVSGGSSTGAVGTVNLAGGSSPYGAPAVGTILLIRRVLPVVQEADFVDNDINSAEVTETAFDKLTMIAQQIGEVNDRGLTIPAVETATTALTELPFDRASKFLAFDASKNMIASSGTVDGAVPVSTFMETVLDDTSAADARTTLGAAGSGAVTGSGLTMTTARLLGRTTASTGAVEEISVGSGLTLSAGSLAATQALGWRVIERQTASNVAAIDFDLPTGYDRFRLDIINVAPATDGATPWVRLSDDDGATFEADASDYRWNSNGGNSSNIENSTADTEIHICGNGPVGNATGERLCGTLFIDGARDEVPTVVSFTGGAITAVPEAMVHVSTGHLVDPVSTEAIRFLFSSGNIASGTFVLSGLVGS